VPPVARSRLNTGVESLERIATGWALQARAGGQPKTARHDGVISTLLPRVTGFLAITLTPLLLLGYAALATLALSALRAGERPLRFWTAFFAGFALQLAFVLVAIGLPAWLKWANVDSRTATSIGNALGEPSRWAGFAGLVLLLLAFASGLPRNSGGSAAEPDPAVEAEAIPGLDAAQT
jgi:hypothetical protein